MRALRRAPRFAALAVAVLASGIGATTVMYTLVRTVLLRALPFEDPERLVWMYNARTERDRAPLSLPDLDDYRREASTLAGLGVFTNWTTNLTGIGSPDRDRSRWACSRFRNGRFGFDGSGVRSRPGLACIAGWNTRVPRCVANRDNESRSEHASALLRRRTGRRGDRAPCGHALDDPRAVAAGRGVARVHAEPGRVGPTVATAWGLRSPRGIDSLLRVGPRPPGGDSGRRLRGRSFAAALERSPLDGGHRDFGPARTAPR